MKLQLELDDNQAWALAQMAKRFSLHHAQQLSDRYARYPDGGQEQDHMIDAVGVLQRALAAAGASPR